MATSNSAVDASTFEETADRIRELNEKLIQLAKESGQNSLDTYEKALQSLLDFEKSAAGRSQLDWVTALANTHVKFVQDLTSFYINAAREALK
jgi:hypothetical protein